MNFPLGLTIHPSDPQAILGHFISTRVLESESHAFHDEDLISFQTADIKRYGIAGRIWEASYAMKLYLQPPSTWQFEPPCSIPLETGAIVELGSGTGFLGFHLARFISLMPGPSGALSPLILTDLEDVCPLLYRNAQQVKGDLPDVDVDIQPLEWGNDAHGDALASLLRTKINVGPGSVTPLLSHVLCSDLVYFPELFAPLLRTLLQLSSPPFSNASKPVEIIISYMVRSLTKELPFWSAFGKWFDFSPVLVRRTSDVAHWERFGSENGGTTFIFVAKRKARSLAWPVPNDSELTNGCDETFENLLLMNITMD